MNKYRVCAVWLYRYDKYRLRFIDCRRTIHAVYVVWSAEMLSSLAELRTLILENCI